MLFIKHLSTCLVSYVTLAALTSHSSINHVWFCYTYVHLHVPKFIQSQPLH